MQIQGVQVRLKLAGCDANIAEHPNPFVTAKDLGKYAGSRLVAIPPGQTFEVEIRFRRDFLSASDVAVFIKYGASQGATDQEMNFQVWYVPASSNELKYKFSGLRIWDGESIQPKEVPFMMPIPIDTLEEISDFSWADEMSALWGCVSVFIVQGQLNTCSEDQDRYSTEPKLPPTDLSRPSVINWNWFRLEHESHAFQFRNMDPDKLKDLQARPKKVAAPATRSSSNQGDRARSLSTNDSTGAMEKRNSDEAEDEPPSKRRSPRTRSQTHKPKYQPLRTIFHRSRRHKLTKKPNETNDDEDDEETLPQPIKTERTPEPQLQHATQTRASYGMPHGEEQRKKQDRSSSSIDLTGDRDSATPTSSHESTNHTKVSFGSTKRKPEALEEESDDEEDMEDEMRMIELRRKLRAKRKQKARAVKTEG